MTAFFNEEQAVKAPNNPDKIALADADTIAYAVCSVCEVGDDEAGYQIDMNYARDTAVGKVQGILEETGCGSIELHFTRGKNFRYSVDPGYKSNRSGTRSPEGLNQLKDILVEEYPNSIMHTEIEADDYVVWAKKYNPDKYVLVAVDKDVLHSVSGEHYNYYQNEKYKINPKWINTSINMPLPWFYLQVLMGDSGDGIEGLPKCGPAGAFKILAPNLDTEITLLKKQYREANGKSASDLLKNIIIPNKLFDKISQDNFELYSRTLAAYKAKGLTEKDVIKTARLVGMHQLNKEGKLDLWLPPIGE